MITKKRNGVYVLPKTTPFLALNINRFNNQLTSANLWKLI